MKYVPIRVSTLKKQSSELDFTVYVFYKDHYLDYIKKNDSATFDRVEKLKKNGIKQLFINEADEEKYQSYLDSRLNNILADETASAEEKVEAVSSSASAGHEGLQKDPNSIKAYKLAEKAIFGLSDLLKDTPDSLVAIFSRKSENEDTLILRHSFNVAALAVKFARMLEIKPEDIKNLAMAAYLHDLGLTTLGEGVEKYFKQELSTLSPEDQKSYKTHPQTAVDWLQGKEYINENILKLILSHEEKINGDGYPKALKKLKPVEEILSLCNVYDKKVTCGGMSFKEALKDIQVNSLGHYELDTINKFKKFLTDEKILKIGE